MELTSITLNLDVYVIVVQEITFWDKICNNEIKLQEVSHSRYQSGNPPHAQLIKTSLTFLIPQLLNTLLKQNVDGNVTSISRAGVEYLKLDSRIVGQELMVLVIQFVT